MTEDEILKEILRRSHLFGVSVVLSPHNYVLCEGIKVSGYFDPDEQNPVLAVGWNHPRRLGVLLHEYSHLTQWVERTPLWVEAEDVKWDEWLSGKKIPKVREQIVASRELEADCERRAVRLIRELEAPIDIADYCRAANSYVHFYNILADVRKWYRPDRRPHSTPEVIQHFNSTLDKDFSETPPELRELLLTCV